MTCRSNHFWRKRRLNEFKYSSSEEDKIKFFISENLPPDRCLWIQQMVSGFPKLCLLLFEKNSRQWKQLLKKHQKMRNYQFIQKNSFKNSETYEDVNSLQVIFHMIIILPGRRESESFEKIFYLENYMQISLSFSFGLKLASMKYTLNYHCLYL